MQQNTIPIPLHWEIIETNDKTQVLYRARVFDGWLVKMVDDFEFRSSITFLPDPNRDWIVKIK